MELRAYLKILQRGWWIVASIFLVTVTSTVVFSFLQTELYQARASYIVSPIAANVGDTVRSLDTLSRREGIANTYAEAASSQALMDMATKDMNLTQKQRSHLDVKSQVVPSTNIIEIIVLADSPALAVDVAEGIGAELVHYIDELFEAYVLTPLDSPVTPRWATLPNRKQNALLGALFGLVLGLSVTYMVDYLRVPQEAVVRLNIIDSRTGAYNEQYLTQRLNEEMIRSRRNNYLLSLGMMYISNLDMVQGANSRQVRDDLLRQIVSFIGQHLRQEDLTAYVGNDSFVFLFPDTSGENAKSIMEYLESRVSWIPFEASDGNVKLNLFGDSTVITYKNNDDEPEELLSKLSKTLRRSSSKVDESVHFLKDKGQTGELYA